MRDAAEHYNAGAVPESRKEDVSVLYLVALTPVDIWAACEPCCIEDVRGVYLQPMLVITAAYASLQFFIMHERSPSPT